MIVAKEIDIFTLDLSSLSFVPLPFYLNTASAGFTGFPSPAEDYIESNLDLNQYLNSRPNSTFYVRASGQSMKDAGIDHGDILVVDRSVRSKDGSIVVCALEGELVVKRLRITAKDTFLISDNPNFKNVRITGEESLVIWGVVTAIVKKL